MCKYIYIILLLVYIYKTYGFAPAGRTRPASKMMSLQVPELTETMSSLLTSLEETKPDDYVYGAVAAPDFVLPLAAFGIIAIAAVPFLLAPGEEALAQQREDEATKGAGFNQRKNRDLR